ncbi:MAG: nucleotide exchange factor GrpE [Acidobacteriota bacterium]
MNSDEQIPMPDDSLNMIDARDVESVDDFIRELEAKEKDLMISADMQIEIEDSDVDDDDVPAFVQAELPPPVRAIPSVAASPVTKARNYELENELSALKVRVLELKAERNDIQEKSDRRLKDFENFKYRMDRERRGSFIDQIANLASQMLPVLDNLDRALSSADRLEGQRSADFEQFFDGIVLVNQQVNDVFAGMGLQAIPTVGMPFDPNFHEAVATDDESDLPPNTVSQEMLRGYRIGNKVVRHSMVRVTTGPSPRSADISVPESVDEDPFGSDDV